MSDILDQGKIYKNIAPSWKKLFSKREYDYLSHVINGLIDNGGLDNLAIQYGERDGRRALHIFEPFTSLNSLGYLSPSVVSISFKDDNKVGFSTGDDNGIGIFSVELDLERTLEFPRNNTPEIDFWHFVDAIGDASNY